MTRGLWRLLPFAVVWGLVCGASAAFGLTMRDQLSPGHAPMIVGLFALGGFMALPPAAYIARFASGRRGRTARFAALFVAVAVATVGLTAALFTVPQYVYYAQWHEPALSKVWFIQLAFTAAGAFYQFAIIGLRLYFPVALGGLFAIAWALARSSR